MRRALVVGINFYQHVPLLSECVNDARAVESVLARNADDSPNFNVALLTATSAAEAVDRRKLKDSIEELFEGAPEVALLYFSGHGSGESVGGYICSSEASRGDDGVSLHEIVQLAGASKATNRVIVLDSCHSGMIGNHAYAKDVAEIRDGMTILTASTGRQAAKEIPGRGGVFTQLFVDALGGAAANLAGEVTPGSVYAHVDRALGSWGQRPVFKTNVSRFVVLRKTTPPIDPAELRQIATLFKTDDYELPLDPSFEPERLPEQLADSSIPKPDLVNNRIFAILQNYVKVNLVVPVGERHMWHAAMHYKSCKLTVLGQHYHDLVAKGLI